MTDLFTLQAETRTDFGKGAARRMRRSGQIPAVLYGHGTEPRHLGLPALAFASAIRHGGLTQVLTINLPDGDSVTALPKAVQRDPIKSEFLHADLLLVRRGEMVTVEVPLRLVGEASPGTLVLLEYDQVAVRADATALPDQIEASIEGLGAGARVLASDLPLPEGTELVTPPDTVMVLVNAAPTAEQLAPTEEAAEVPAEAGTEAGGA